MVTYEREDFDPVRGVPGKYYCPGCNRSPDDYCLPSKGCPCDLKSNGQGSLNADEVDAYLVEHFR